MRVVTPTDMRARLGEILDAASAGEKILIARDHKPLAVLMSVEDADRLDEGKRQAEIDRRLKALDELVAFGKRYRAKYPPGPGDMTAVEWIRWDRDHGHDTDADTTKTTRQGRPAGVEAVAEAEEVR